MTYCVGIKTHQHIIMASDSRTGAGVDNISTYSKMCQLGIPGERQFVVCSAGNLATTQAVIAALKRDMKNANTESLFTVPDMHAAATYIGKLSVEEQKKFGGGPVFETTFLLGGEIAGSSNGLYLIYAQGNFIESSPHVPFLQIGETKYGKPILDQMISREMSLDQAVVSGLISMDQTVRSNLMVGPPIELYILGSGNLNPGKYLFFEDNNEYMRSIRHQWNEEIESVIGRMPVLNW